MSDETSQREVLWMARVIGVLSIILIGMLFSATYHMHSSMNDIEAKLVGFNRGVEDLRMEFAKGVEDTKRDLREMERLADELAGRLDTP